MRSFNFKMVSQLKHIQLTKHMHYCIQKIYHVYYTTQWNFIILSKFSHMTLTSSNQKWMRVADIVRRFCHFLLYRGEFYFDGVGNFEPKKIDYFLPFSLLLSICYILMHMQVKMCSIVMLVVKRSNYSLTCNVMSLIILGIIKSSISRGFFHDVNQRASR